MSAWESETNPAAPSRARIRDLATFYASERSWNGERRPTAAGRGTLARQNATTAKQLARELQLCSSYLSRPTDAADRRRDQIDTLVPAGPGHPHRRGRLDDLETKGHPYTDPEDLNYTDLLTFADADALIELFGFLRKVNPDSDVRFTVPTGCWRQARPMTSPAI